MDDILTINKIKDFKKTFNKSRTNKIIANTVQKNGIWDSAFDSEEARKLNPVFSNEIKDFPSVTNQKRSGRCWMFAALNVLRGIIAKNLGVKDIELSESYLMFYDKLEKSNVQLETVLNTLNEKDDSRLMERILDLGGQTDGGYWGYFVNLVKKYGVVPQAIMPEVFSSSDSAQMNTVIDQLITKDTIILRNGYKEGKDVEELRELKGRMLEEIYKVLAICLGQPVDKFTFEYIKDAPKDKKEGDLKLFEDEEKESSFARISTTPLDFFNNYCGKNLDDYISLVNWPMPNMKEYQLYSFKYINNVIGSDKMLFINVPVEDLKVAAIQTIKDNEPLWFACDVSTFSNRQDGYLSTEILDIDNLLGVSLYYDKGQRLLYRSSQCNHAMTLTGVNLDKNGNPNKWKVQNSWGTDIGHKGIYVMSDKWFDEFVYEVVVNKKYLNEKMQKAMKGKVIDLDIWSPASK